MLQESLLHGGLNVQSPCDSLLLHVRPRTVDRFHVGISPPPKAKVGWTVASLVSVTHPAPACQVTSVLLEVDDSEPLCMLQSPESLQSLADGCPANPSR